MMKLSPACQSWQNSISLYLVLRYFDCFINHFKAHYIGKKLHFRIFQDGTVNMYTLKKGEFVRTLHPKGCQGVDINVKFIVLSHQGHIGFVVNDQVGFISFFKF